MHQSSPVFEVGKRNLSQCPVARDSTPTDARVTAYLGWLIPTMRVVSTVSPEAEVVPTTSTVEVLAH